MDEEPSKRFIAKRKFKERLEQRRKLRDDSLNNLKKQNVRILEKVKTIREWNTREKEIAEKVINKYKEN